MSEYDFRMPDEGVRREQMIMMQKQSKLHEIIKKRIKNINERTNKKYRGGVHLLNLSLRKCEFYAKM